MPETTAIEEQAKLYERSIHDLKHGHQEAIELHVARYHELEERAKEREVELKAQADGLLGALGRVNTENTEMKARFEAECKKRDELRFELIARMTESQMKMERLKDENARLIKDAEVLQEQAHAEIQKLQEELAKAKGKK